MRKLVAGFAASVDGYIEGPNREIDWIIIDEKIDFAAYTKRFDAFFFGRRSYEVAVKIFDKPTAGTTNYVVSNSLQTVETNFVLLRGDIEGQVSELKQRDGKDMALYGGASLLASFLNLRLVDELTISYIPVLLGSGKPMVDMLDERVGLSFLSSRRYGNGTITINYAVQYSPPETSSF
jgi:dihydrofolate reductase